MKRGSGSEITEGSSDERVAKLTSNRPDFEALVSGLPAPAQALYRDHRSKILASPGSGTKHQAWPGGYADHVIETFEIAADMYGMWRDKRPMPFTLEEAQTVMFLHDIEKPFKYSDAETPEEEAMREMARSDPKGFRAQIISRYGIELTEAQENALRYVHGEPDDEYNPHTRLAGPLAAFCHCCDYLSARLWFDQPAPAASA